jgi:hypothetical protein
VRPQTLIFFGETETAGKLEHPSLGRKEISIGYNVFIFPKAMYMLSGQLL